jgi:hypothetical protein
MPPSISVILNVTEAGAPLTRAMESLRAQTLAADRFEMIAINNGAGDQAQAVLDSYANVRSFRQSAVSDSAAWNLGAFAALSPVIVLAPKHQAFEPSCLHALLAAHARHDKPSDIVHAAWSSGSALQQAVASEAAPWRSPHGAISFKRTLLVNHGLFDARFADGWERAELLWRVRARRVRLVAARDAQVQWSTALSFHDECARCERQGQFHARLAALHDSALVRSRSEIGAALALWSRRGAAFEDVLAHATAVGTPEAYREAFALCRAKGVAAETGLG